MLSPKVYADFQRLDDSNRLILDCQGTRRDLDRQGIPLREGLELTLYTDDQDDDGRPLELLVDAVVHYDPTASRWVAAIDWDAIHHAEASDATNGTHASDGRAAHDRIA
jgi:hypothetical protein